jgi:hypothetical protein
MEKRTIKARELAENGQAVQDASRQFGASLEGQNQLGDAAAEKAAYDQTQKRQRLVVARKFAVAQLRDEGQLDTTASNFEDWAKDFVLNGANSIKVQEWSGDQKTTATRIDTRVRENLVKSAKGAGIDVEARHPGFTHGSQINALKMIMFGPQLIGRDVGATGQDLDRVMNEVGPELEKKGIGLDGSGLPANRAGGPGAPAPPPPPPPTIGANRGPGDPNNPASSGMGNAAGDSGRGVVSAVDQVGSKIDRQTDAIVSAIRGRGGSAGGTGGGATGTTMPALPNGSGVNPGRP